MTLVSPNTHPVLVIPVYQPGQSLVSLIQDILQQHPEQTILIVNDGSTGQSREVIAQLAAFSQVVVLHHAVHLGKGHALKTAFNYFLLHYANHSWGIVIAEANGRHSTQDIHALRAQFQQCPTAMWLGVRQSNYIPFFMRVGNFLTQKMVQLILGKSGYDMQTGLCGIPREVLPDLMTLPVVGNEFESDMLMRVIRLKIPIKKVIIETKADDPYTPFNPIVDSLKGYFVFLRYMTVSLGSAIIDFICFVILHSLSQHILFSLTSARGISGTINFLLCKKVIFKSGKNMIFEALKYIALAIFSLTLSYILVMGLVSYCEINLYLSKIIADICVFLINFTIQKVVVFPITQVEIK